jgi:hypothetical protein
MANIFKVEITGELLGQLLLLLLHTISPAFAFGSPNASRLWRCKMCSHGKPLQANTTLTHLWCMYCCSPAVEIGCCSAVGLQPWPISSRWS